MMVTFISQCQKKSLNKTRRVLDTFANRIGDNTWQTVITSDGLVAVKKLLRKTASKNTAVSCFWIRSRSRSELVWVVGNKDKFNTEGVVPVNSTSKDMTQYIDKNQWKTIEVIKYASAIAGLFHDFGKANLLFQNKLHGKSKLKGEPYRHEWLSLRLFQSFVDGKTDQEWLEVLSEIEKDSISTCYKDGIDTDKDHPIKNLASFAQLVAWLIVSHHKLPLVPQWKKDSHQYTAKFDKIANWFDEKNFAPFWNSYQCLDKDKKQYIKDNWNFENTLPVISCKWRNKAADIATDARRNLKGVLSSDIDWLHGELYTAHLARLCLMLSDHYYSSLSGKELNPQWQSLHYKINDRKVLANTIKLTDGEGREANQQLDEHLIGVAYNAKNIASKLVTLIHSLKKLPQNNLLEKNNNKDTPSKFTWQNKAKKIAESIAQNTVKSGFFGINMASTGMGKTLANAKIMYALANETNGVRFSVALGLRTLTLQTGKEFHSKLFNDIKDSKEQLSAQKNVAIAVGGIAVKQLFENNQLTNEELEQQQESGSASENDIIDNSLYVDYDCAEMQHDLSTWTKQEKTLNKLLHAPILVCTIDHLMPATEGTKGGKQIAPMLRLLTSDLVLDEPDDFGLNDLPALCRLVHWTAMLGRRVLLSTATMPPAMAFALFQAYQAGWAEYAKANIADWHGEITCAWFDDYENNSISHSCSGFDVFYKNHTSFVKKREKALEKDKKIKQLGEIKEIVEGSDVTNALAQTIQNNIISLHQSHHANNGTNSSKQTVTIGLVRMANINPLIAVAKKLLALPVNDDTSIHYCIYHSRYPLSIRAHIENNLDDILNRKDPEMLWQKVASSLNSSNKKHHAFVVIASPVAEVGRDHDYDWAIIEPSSMRSIIQIAGRILRHREDIYPQTANVVLLNENYKALNAKDVCFDRPGFESTKLKLYKHNLLNILEPHQYQKIDAIERIKELVSYPTENDGKYFNLNTLEHKALNEQLFTINKLDKSADVWWKEKVHWCGEVQNQQKFRDSNKDNAFYLYLRGDEYHWQWLNENVRPAKLGEPSLVRINMNHPEVEVAEGNNFWFDLSPHTIYEKLVHDFSIDLNEVAKRFGEIRLTEYKNDTEDKYEYHPQLGVYQEIGK